MNIQIANGVNDGSSIVIKDDNGNVMVSMKDSKYTPCSGDVVMESDNVVIIGGNRITCGNRIAGITIDGNVNSIQKLPNIVVNGNVGNVSSTSGDIEIHGNVNGSVSAVSGDVDVRGSVAGSVSTVSGDVEVRNNQSKE